MNIQEFDLLSGGRYAASGYPHAEWAYLRAHHPVVKLRYGKHGEYWAITTYADIGEISRQPAIFSSKGSILMQDVANTEESGTRTLLNMDPPDHMKFRQVAAPWFSPSNMRSMEERVRGHVRGLLTQVRERDGEPFDFVETVAARLPLRMIMHLLGLPPQEEETLLRISNALIAAQDPEYALADNASEATKRGIQQIFDYFTGIYNARREKPSEDIASYIANGTVDGAPLPMLEALSYFLVLITAGHDTTRTSLAGGMLAFAQNPQAWQAYQGNPAATRSATEEIIRWVSPVIHFCRTTVEDYTLRGQTIRAGERICMFYPSANRDEDVFADPFEFRLARSPNQHLAFGSGEHYCLGANLARLQVRVYLEELMPQLRSVELAGEPQRTASNIVGALKHLPLSMRLQSAAA